MRVLWIDYKKGLSLTTEFLKMMVKVLWIDYKKGLSLTIFIYKTHIYSLWIDYKKGLSLTVLIPFAGSGCCGLTTKKDYL